MADILISLDYLELALEISSSISSSVYVFHEENFDNVLGVTVYPVTVNVGTGKRIIPVTSQLSVVVYPVSVRARGTFTTPSTRQIARTSSGLDTISSQEVLSELIEMDLNNTIADLKVVNNNLTRLPVKRTREWEEKVVANVSDRQKMLYLMKHKIYNYPLNRSSFTTGLSRK